MKIIKAEKWTLKDALRGFGRSLVEIDGKLPITDPDQSLYDTIASDLRGLTWDDFEELTASLLEEVGFCDVHRLTRGSQQGKDIIAIWYSRFSLGQRIKFRFQCKHKQTDSILRKREVGDSISDFLVQKVDEILVIVSNSSLSNDLIDLLDRASDDGVYPIAGNQFIRLLTCCPATLSRFLKHNINAYESLHHVFEFREWFETRSSLKKQNSLVFNLHRFWTEPYIWFFYKNQNKEIERLWTTVGGEFRFTCYNRSFEIQETSGIRLVLLEKEELPEFGIINITPKGGHQIKRVEIPLSSKLGEFDLSPENNALMAPGESYTCLLDFVGIDPGIYSFKIQYIGPGGSINIRETEVLKIAYIPDPPPTGIMTLHGFWPSSLLIIERIFALSVKERNDIFEDINSCSILLFRDEDGTVQLRYHTPDSDDNGYIPDMKSLSCPHPLTEYLWVSSNSATSVKFSYLMNWRAWCEERLDHTEPRSPLSRAELLMAHKAKKEAINDALAKAHERTPWHPKINAFLAFRYYSLGYLGFAQFHFDVAYLASPGNPAIAGIHYLLKKKLKKTPNINDYLPHLSQDAVEGFNNLVHTAKFPRSYWEANVKAFPGRNDLHESWSSQIW